MPDRSHWPLFPSLCLCLFSITSNSLEIRGKQHQRHRTDRATVPVDEYCVADVVVDKGTCGNELMPTMSVRYEAGSQSGLCPPGACVVDAVIKFVHLPETRLYDNYSTKPREYRVRADGCGVLGPKVEQPVYTITPLQLACIFSVRAVCSACESH
jgi:hypothetical protein